MKYYALFVTLVIVNMCVGSHFNSNYISPSSSFGEQFLLPSQLIGNRGRSFTIPGYRSSNQIGAFRISHQLLGKTNDYFRQKPVIPILQQNVEQNLDGSYFYKYRTANGISSEERRDQNEAIGSYSYTGPDGLQYTVTYRAGKNGFEPIGAHLPISPRIPDTILKSLSENAAEEAAGIYDDGSYRPERYEKKSYNRYHAYADYPSDYNY